MWENMPQPRQGKEALKSFSRGFEGNAQINIAERGNSKRRDDLLWSDNYFKNQG
jgi:hypothetical protein